MSRCLRQLFFLLFDKIRQMVFIMTRKIRRKGKARTGNNAGKGEGNTCTNVCGLRHRGLIKQNAANRGCEHDSLSGDEVQYIRHRTIRDYRHGGTGRNGLCGRHRVYTTGDAVIGDVASGKWRCSSTFSRCPGGLAGTVTDRIVGMKKRYGRNYRFSPYRFYFRSEIKCRIWLR